MVEITIKKAYTVKEKITGLIGQKLPYPFLLETRWGIHTFGVKFPLDIVILDEKYIVRDVYHNLHPNRIFLWNPRYRYVLELPQETIHKLRLAKGMRVRLVIQ